MIKLLIPSTSICKNVLQSWAWLSTERDISRLEQTSSQRSSCVQRRPQNILTQDTGIFIPSIAANYNKFSMNFRSFFTGSSVNLSTIILFKHLLIVEHASDRKVYSQEQIRGRPNEVNSKFSWNRARKYPLRWKHVNIRKIRNNNNEAYAND